MRDLNTDGHYGSEGTYERMLRLGVCKIDLKFPNANKNTWNKGDIVLLQSKSSKPSYPDIYYANDSGIYIEDFEIDILPQDIIEHIIAYHLKYKMMHPMCKFIDKGSVGGALLRIPY